MDTLLFLLLTKENLRENLLEKMKRLYELSLIYSVHTNCEKGYFQKFAEFLW